MIDTYDVLEHNSKIFQSGYDEGFEAGILQRYNTQLMKARVLVERAYVGCAVTAIACLSTGFLLTMGVL